MRANATLPVGTYGYQPVDLAFLNDRVAQFRDQVARRRDAFPVICRKMNSSRYV